MEDEELKPLTDAYRNGEEWQVWEVTNLNYQSYEIVSGSPQNSELPGGGPGSQPSCPQWPSLVDDIKNQSSPHLFQGSQAMPPNTSWMVMRPAVDLGGFATMTHDPSSQYWTRTVFGRLFQGSAGFYDVTPGLGGG